MSKKSLVDLTMNKKDILLTPMPVEPVIRTVRGQKVILDYELAKIYGIQTYRLNEAVKRNRERFPEDFMFQISKEEQQVLRSQNATLKPGRGGRRTVPYAFTEHGALMAANILKSETAVAMSIYVVRAFIRMRRELTSRSDLEKRLDKIEKILLVHNSQLKDLFEKIRPLLLPPPNPPRKRIGFGVEKSGKKNSKRK